MSTVTSTLNMNPHNQRCDFCDEFSGGDNNAFSLRYEEIDNRTVFVTDNFRVLPSLGQIVEGHLMIVPTAHYATMGDLPLTLSTELETLSNLVRVALSQTYGNCVLFEHGTRGPEGGGCGIYHAHLHVVPLCDEKDPIYELKELHSFLEIGGFEELARTSYGYSYLYYETLSSQRYVCRVEHLPSQYMRRFLAQFIGKSQWNWREVGKEPELCSAVVRLSDWFARCGAKSETPQAGF
jgi:diadenosine tetraphosphate (Ap4A) HIT family hydrolase